MVGKATLGIFALLIVGLVASAGVVSAFMGRGIADDDTRTALVSAIENNDYEAWREASLEALTEENFEKLVQRHEMMKERRALHEETRQAIVDGDYEAYVEALDAESAARVMSEEDFNTLVEIHAERMENGEEMGPGMGPGKGMGRGMMTPPLEVQE